MTFTSAVTSRRTRSCSGLCSKLRSGSQIPESLKIAMTSESQRENGCRAEDREIHIL